MRAGVVINGLPILVVEPFLDQYYWTNVIGGPNAFVIAVESYEAFAEAVLKKLIIEVSARPADGRTAQQLSLCPLDPLRADGWRCTGLVPGDVAAGAHDDAGTDPGEHVRQIAGDDVADDDGAHELPVAEGGNDAGLGVGHGAGDEIVRRAADDAEREQQPGIGPRRDRRPHERRDDRHDDGADQRAVDRSRFSRVVASDPAGQDLVQRIADGAAQHVERGPLEHVGAGANDDQHAQEGHDDGGQPVEA